MPKGFLVENVYSDVTNPYNQYRDCLEDIMDYLYADDSRGQICALYGLRRTGKTTLLRQAAKSLPEPFQAKALYLKCYETGCDFHDVIAFVSDRIKEGYTYFFIDEITYAENFQGLATVLSDGFVNINGAKIVVTGTDSLALSIVSQDAMYDRIEFINTSYIPFPEYSRITGCNSFDEYIKKGCTLTDTFSSFNKTQDYVRTAIVNNIINSLEKSEGIRRFPSVLTEDYDKEQISNEIQRQINKYSQTAIKRAITKVFKSAPVHDALDFADKHTIDFPHLKDKINISKVDANIARMLNTENVSGIKDSDIVKITGFLKNIGVLKTIPYVSDFRSSEALADAEEFEDKSFLEMFTHPGMFHANIAHALSVLADEGNWINASAAEKNYIITKAYESAMGKITENIVISDCFDFLCDSSNTHQSLFLGDSRWYVSKFAENINGKNCEADLIIYDRINKNVWLFEVKHSSEFADEQSVHLENKDMLKYINDNFGTIRNTALLYNGDNIRSNVPRLSIKDFLKHMYDHKDDPEYTPDMTIEALLKRKVLSPEEKLEKIKQAEDKVDVKNKDESLKKENPSTDSPDFDD